MIQIFDLKNVNDAISWNCDCESFELKRVKKKLKCIVENQHRFHHEIQAWSQREFDDDDILRLCHEEKK